MLIFRGVSILDFRGVVWGISSLENLKTPRHHRKLRNPQVFWTFCVGCSSDVVYWRISNSGKLFIGIQHFLVGLILYVQSLYQYHVCSWWRPRIVSLDNIILLSHVITLINSYCFHMLRVLVFVSLYELGYDDTWMWMSNSLSRTWMVGNLNMLHWKFWEKKTASGLALQHGRSKMFI